MSKQQTARQAPPQQQAPPAASTELVKLEPAGALALPDYLQEVTGREGFEQVTREDYVIPRLSTCQALTPQRQKTNADKYIPGLEEGQLFNTVTGQIYGDRVYAVPLMLVKAPRIYFKPKSEGGGVLCQSFNGKTGGRLSPTCSTCPKKEWDGQKPPLCTQFDSFPLILLPSRELIMFALKSSGIKLAKQWLTRMSSAPFVNKPMYAGIYEIKVIGMVSENRPFFGQSITLVPLNNEMYSRDLFEYAKATAADLANVTFRVDDTEDDAAPGASAPGADPNIPF